MLNLLSHHSEKNKKQIINQTITYKHQLICQQFIENIFKYILVETNILIYLKFFFVGLVDVSM